VFASGFLQIPPHDGHPCLWLIIPTVKAYSGLSPPSCRPCRAHNQINYLSVLIGSFIIFNSVNVISVTAQTEAEYNINEENTFDTTDVERGTKVGVKNL